MIGNQIAAGQALTIANDSFNGDGSTVAFTLSQTVSSVNDIEVLVDNVQQSPYDSSYSVSGTTLTFSGAPSAGTNNVYVIYNASRHITTQQVIPDDGTITVAKLHSGLSVPDSNIAAIAASKLTGNVAAANMSAGSVLQVITKHCTTNGNTISTTSYTAVGMDITITPKRSGSHFLAQAFWLVYDWGSSGTMKVESALFRNGTNITGNLTHTPYDGTGGSGRMPYGGQSTIDAGASAVAGTAISYSYKFKKNLAGEQTYDVAHNDGKSAFLTIMEIAQ